MGDESFLQGRGLEKWIFELGVTDAPVPRAGITTALQFFRRRMPDLSRRLMVSFLKAMDLSRPVGEVTLNPGDIVVAFRKNNEDPFKLFYTRTGNSVQSLGLNPESRGFCRYRVISSVAVLESRCAGAIDSWTNSSRYFMAAGGSTQLIIPDSRRVLELIQYSEGQNR